jgi:hypothetical protein
LCARWWAETITIREDRFGTNAEKPQNKPGVFSLAVAILYSETTDIWRQAEGPIDKKTGKTELGPLRGDQNSAMSDFRTAYLALKHANLEVDVLIEVRLRKQTSFFCAVLYIVAKNRTVTKTGSGQTKRKTQKNVRTFARRATRWSGG